MNFCILIVLLVIPVVRPDLASDRLALLAIRKALGGRSLLWNVTSLDPCTFSGIVCSLGRVTGLHLPGMSLVGNIPENTLGNLTKLNTLSLRFNALSGSLPEDISSLKELRRLYLQSNLFNGPIPESVFTLKNLVRLNLASNRFSGPISADFNSLNRLKTLYLENNNFTGPIPVLNYTGLLQLNVSNNHLTGSIPVQLAKRPLGSFSGNSDLCGKPLDPCDRKAKKKLLGRTIARIIIGSLIGFLVILSFMICYLLKNDSFKSGSKEESALSEENLRIPAEKAPRRETRIKRKQFLFSPLPVSVKKGEADLGADKKLVFFGKQTESRYDLEDLLRASAEVLGKGTLGTSYKAVMEGRIVVVVKRLKDVTVAEKEFRNKIERVGRMENENLVVLRACYFSRDEKLLVYDYMPSRSLSALLHGNTGETTTLLNWKTRLSIVLGASRGIAYLHSQGPTVSHGNIKSSNVLLTKFCEARISDFCLNQLAGPTPIPNSVQGYRAPEVTDPRKVYQKSDVYSFGVLILEILTGKFPNEVGLDLPRWIKSVVQEEWNDKVFDPELLRYQSIEEEMVQLLHLAIKCVAQHPDNRPSMSDVSHQIEELCRSIQVEDVFQDADEYSK